MMQNPVPAASCGAWPEGGLPASALTGSMNYGIICFVESDKDMLPRQIEPGTRFGALVVRRPAGKDPKTCKSLSECACDCGAVVVKRNNDLLTGRVVSCGCVKRERSRRMMWERAERSNANHMSQTPLYRCWYSMVQRCTNPRDRRYDRYGGRGIGVSKAWLMSFRKFRDWAMSRGYADGLELDRIDPDGWYCPSNCRFADHVTLANSRSNNRVIEYNGRRMTVMQWSREIGAGYGTLKAGTGK